MAGGTNQVVHVGIVVILTSVWWACAVGVTLVLKVALGSDSSSVPGAWNFPYPLTLTLLANLGTAVSCGLLASLAPRHGNPPGIGRPPVELQASPPLQHPVQTEFPTSFPRTPRTMLRAASCEALLESSSSNNVPVDPATAVAALARGDYAGCPGGTALASCACWSRRRNRMAPGQAHSLELEVLPEPELLLALPGDDCKKLPSPSYGGQPVISALGTTGYDPGGTPSPATPSSTSGLFSEQNLSLLTMGLIQSLALGAKNEALLLLSVSTRTMVFATNVLVVMLVARLFGIEKLKKVKVVAAFLLAVGGMLQGLATWQKLRADGDASENAPLGYTLALSALVLDALRWVLLQAVFTQDQAHSAEENPAGGATAESGNDRPEGCDEALEHSKVQVVSLSKLRMVSWVMWAGTPVCLGISLFFEPRGLEHASKHPAAIFGLVALLTLGVMGINIAEFGIVQWTSAVTFNVLSQLHGIPLVLAGITFFGESITPVQVLGFAICVVGALLYSFVKAQEKRMPTPTMDGPESRNTVLEVPFTPVQNPSDGARHDVVISGLLDHPSPDLVREVPGSMRTRIGP